MFDIFCCVGFDSLFFVKTGEKHPRFYIKIFCFLNIKKARKHGLFKVSIHLVSPIWLRETATYFSHDTFQIFIFFSKIEKNQPPQITPRRLNYYLIYFLRPQRIFCTIRCACLQSFSDINGS